MSLSFIGSQLSSKTMDIRKSQYVTSPWNSMFCTLRGIVIIYLAKFFQRNIFQEAFYRFCNSGSYTNQIKGVNLSYPKFHDDAD